MRFVPYRQYEHKYLSHDEDDMRDILNGLSPYLIRGKQACGGIYIPTVALQSQKHDIYLAYNCGYEGIKALMYGQIDKYYGKNIEYQTSEACTQRMKKKLTIHKIKLLLPHEHDKDSEYYKKGTTLELNIHPNILLIPTIIQSKLLYIIESF